MKHYRAAIVGLGNVAWKYDHNILDNRTGPQTHAGVYKVHKQTTLVGGCSPEEQDRIYFARQYGVAVFDNIEELLKRTTPDIVSICSPSQMHYKHACQCIEAQIPMIWLEKPPVTELGDLDALIEKQKGSASTILVNYQRRYCRCYNRLKDLYMNRLLGKTMFIHITYSRGLLLNGSHIIDVLFYILGDNTKLSLGNVLPSDNGENYSFSLMAPNGLKIFVAGISLPYHCIDISLTCEKGRASVLYGGMETRLETKVEHELFRGFYRLKVQKSGILGRGGLNRVMTGALDDLIISSRQRKEPRSSLRTSRNTLVVIDYVRQAVESI